MKFSSIWVTSWVSMLALTVGGGPAIMMVSATAPSGGVSPPAGGGPGDATSVAQDEEKADGDEGVSEKFKYFVAHPDSMTCSNDVHGTPFNNQVRGVNLGGWMVLEPWITPSLFYQFLGGNDKSTAMDTYTFCEVLGPEEANRQLRRHWATWVTEDIIRELALSGAVNSLRLPVGDYQYKPYGPYEGCFDGSLEYIDLVLNWAHEYGLTVLFDIHAMRDSQNGFDNSGQTMGFQYTSSLNSEFGGLTTFEHWPIRTAEWMGSFNPNDISYDKINYDNIQHSLEVIEEIVDRYAGHPAVLGLEPVNEPWQYTPIEELKKFYWEGYLIVKRKAPYWKYIMHDSFRFDVNLWGGFMAGCPDRALDTHIYQAWNEPGSRVQFYNNACAQKGAIAAMERAFGPVVVGEWSLATDNCAMWLNGFNDNLPGFPRLPCKYIPCSDPYMGFDQPGTPIDPGKGLQGPFGTGISGPVYGMCPVDRDWIRESSGDPSTGTDWIKAPPDAPAHRDDTDNVMSHLAKKKINAFSGIGHGFYFWNFRTDVYEPQWSYMAALEKGWIPKGDLNDASITDACRKEDIGEFKCSVMRTALPSSVRGAIKDCLEQFGDYDNDWVDVLDGDDLYDQADTILGGFWEEKRSIGVTCDFGGIATLTELTYTPDGNMEDDWPYPFDDDSYVVYVVPNMWAIVGSVVGATLVGGSLGFVFAMRYNKIFNKRVRSSSLFNSLPLSHSSAVQNSLAIFDYEDIPEIEFDKK